MKQNTRANFNEEDSTSSPNPSFEDVSQARLGSRDWIKGATLGVATTEKNDGVIGS